MGKIFVIGFPKAGTSSIHDALERAGVKSLHWAWMNPPNHLPCHVSRFGNGVTIVGMMIKYAKEHGLPLLHFLDEFDAFTQMDVCLDENLVYWPQLVDVPLLDQQYPNSKFIFNTRPMEKWLSSVNRWNDLKKRLTRLDLPGLPYGVGGTDAELSAWYDWHENNMIAYFKDKPEKFLRFDIEQDKSQLLEKFLGVGKIKLGHKNANKRNPVNHPSDCAAAVHS